MTASGNKDNTLYSQEDVQQILHLAIARQANDDKEFSYQELLEIAAELEIPPDCLQLAERDWKSNQLEVQQRQAFNKYRRTKLHKQVGKYVIVNSFLIPINLLSAGEVSWSLYVLLFWGLGVGLNAWNTYHTKGEDYEKAFQKWYRQYQVRNFFNNAMNKWFKAWQI
jgi:hypothetical protein